MGEGLGLNVAGGGNVSLRRRLLDRLVCGFAGGGHDDAEKRGHGVEKPHVPAGRVQRILGRGASVPTWQLSLGWSASDGIWTCSGCQYGGGAEVESACLRRWVGGCRRRLWRADCDGDIVWLVLTVIVVWWLEYMRSGLEGVLEVVEAEMLSHETDAVEYLERRGQPPDLSVYRGKTAEIVAALSRHADAHKEFAIAVLDGERLVARRRAQGLEFVPAMEGFAAERLVNAKQKVGDSAVAMASLLAEEPDCRGRPGRRKRLGSSCLSGLLIIGLGFGAAACTDLVFSPVAGLPGALGVFVGLAFFVGALFQWNPWDGWYGFREKGRFAYWMTHSVESDGLTTVPFGSLRAAVGDDSGAAALAADPAFDTDDEAPDVEAPEDPTEQEAPVEEEELAEDGNGAEGDGGESGDAGGQTASGESQGHTGGSGGGDDSADGADAADVAF